MAITVQINGGNEDSKFAPASDGYHTAVLADILPLGIRPGPYGEKDEIVLVWLLDEKNGNGEPKDVLDFVSTSLFKSATMEAKLRKRITALRGKDLSETESKANSYDIEVHIGGCVKMLTEQSEGKGGKLRAKVIQTKPVEPGKEITVPASFVRDINRPLGERLAPKLGATVQSQRPQQSSGSAAARAILAPASQSNVAIADGDIPF